MVVVVVMAVKMKGCTRPSSDAPRLLYRTRARAPICVTRERDSHASVERVGRLWLFSPATTSGFSLALLLLFFSVHLHGCKWHLLRNVKHRLRAQSHHHHHRSAQRLDPVRPRVLLDETAIRIRMTAGKAHLVVGIVRHV